MSPEQRYRVTFNATDHTPSEWVTWLVRHGKDKNLAVEDVTDVCAQAKCTATLRDGRGSICGMVDERGNYQPSAGGKTP